MKATAISDSKHRREGVKKATMRSNSSARQPEFFGAVSLIRRRRPAVTQGALEVRLEMYLSEASLGAEVVRAGTLEVAWVDGGSADELYLGLKEPTGWQLRGECDLVGRYGIGDQSAAGSIKISRGYSPLALGVALARFYGSQGHHFDVDDDSDRMEIFGLLSAYTKRVNYPIPTEISLQLTESLGTHDMHQLRSMGRDPMSLAPALALLSSHLRVVGYEPLWNEAFARLR